MAGFCSDVFKCFYALTSLKGVSGKKSSQQHRADLCSKTLKTFSVTVTEKDFHHIRGQQLWLPGLNRHLLSIAPLSKPLRSLSSHNIASGPFVRFICS